MAGDDILRRLRRFRNVQFPRFRRQFRALVDEGQRPTTLFIGCSDSRVVPYLLTGSGPGELFMVRNVGNLVPPFDASQGFHGTAAAIEFAVLTLKVREIVICGHSHCGAIRALYADPNPATPHTNRWLDLARDAALPVQPAAEALRRTEQRSVALQMDRLMSYPMVAEIPFATGHPGLLDPGQETAYCSRSGPGAGASGATNSPRSTSSTSTVPSSMM